MNTGRTLLMTAALALAGLTACGGDAAEQEEVAEAAVTLSAQDVATATREAVAGGVVVTGTLNPYRVVEVRAQIPGVLTSLSVDRGSAVRQGQAIARIEAEGIRGQAAGARAGVAAAQANLALARRQHESARKLFEAGAMSEIEMQQATAGLQAAEAQLAAAQAQAAAATESAQRATVVSPIGGEVSQRHASEGEAVNPGQAIVTVVDSRVLELSGQVPVNQAVQIRAGMPVSFSLEAFPGRVLTGSVARIEPTADAGTRNIGVYVQVPNADRTLVGGLFATGRIETGATSEAIVIPAAAARTDASGAFVWVVTDGRAVQRRIVVGARDESRGTVQVTEGLDAGEQVIVSPGEVRDGMPVRIGAPATVTGAER